MVTVDKVTVDLTIKERSKEITLRLYNFSADKDFYFCVTEKEDNTPVYLSVEENKRILDIIEKMYSVLTMKKGE